MVEIDDSLNLRETVVDLRQLCRQQGLLCGQHFEVRRAAVAHQKLGALDGSFQRSDLFLAQIDFGACRLAFGEGVVHFGSRVEQGLLERQQGLLLLRFGDSKLCLVSARVEDGLYERCRSVEDPFGGIERRNTSIVGPTQRTAQTEGRIERRPGSGRVVKGLCQRVFGIFHVGTVGEHLRGNADHQILRKNLLVERAAFEAAGSFPQQRREAVFHFADLVLQVEQRGFDRIVACFGLRNRRFVGHTRLFHGPHRIDGFEPFFSGFRRDLVLSVEHQQRVVEIGDGGDDLRADSLLVLLALCEKSFRPALAVGEFAENIDLPAGRYGNGVGPRGVPRVGQAAHASVRSEVERGQVCQACRLQRRFRLFYAPVSRLEVGVVVQSLLDELLQVRIGEHLLPGNVPQGHRIDRFDPLAVEPVGFDLFRPCVGLVNAAASHGGCGKYDD